MFREIAQIVLGIHLSAPHLPMVKAEQFAPVIQQQAQAIDVDPLTIVSIIEHESLFRERVISADGQDYGLMQVRAKFHLHNRSGDWLLNGTSNIRAGVRLLKYSRDLCASVLGREPKVSEFVACYAGSCYNHERMCKPINLSRQIEKYQDCLETDILYDTHTDCRNIYWPPKKR